MGEGCDGDISPVKHLELGLQDHRCCSGGSQGGSCREEGGSRIHPPLHQPHKPLLPALHVSIPYSRAGAEDDPGAAVALDMPVVVAVVLERGDGNLR